MFYNLDLTVFRFLYSLASGTLASGEVFTFVARFVPYGTVALAVLVAIVFLWRFRSRAALEWVAFIFGTSIIARFLFAEIIRRAYPRPRPFEVLPDVIQLITHDPGGAFPSGHAAFFFALAASWWLFNRQLGYGFGLVALGIGIARIAVGVHWPSDVLAGALLGIAVPLLVAWLGRFERWLDGLRNPKPAA